VRKNFSLRAERDAIRRELKFAATFEMQMYRHLRNVGEHWIAVKVELGNRGLSIHRWAKDNVSIGRQWLDRHAELYKRWTEFLEARKWADSIPYSPNRQLGLETAFRLMDEKKRFDVLSAARRRVYDAASKRGAPAICDDSPSVIDGVDFHVGEAIEVLRRLKDQSVHCAVTSPPYFNATRDYRHAHQVGHENTIDDYISRLVLIFGEMRRVLRDDGSLWICMGDSYAGAGGAWTDGEKPRAQSRPAPVGYKQKDLILVGARLAMTLQADGWLLRNAVVWRKLGIRPESAKDRFTRSYETIYLLTKGARYYFSQTDTREPMVTKPNVAARKSDAANDAVSWPDALERNGRDVWDIATSKHTGGLHPAVYPEELARRCIAASCPAGGTVLDPFAGSCTTGIAALRLGCRATMIEVAGFVETVFRPR
jgi:DNA modification methylase